MSNSVFAFSKFGNVCRLCMQAKPSLLSLFSENETTEQAMPLRCKIMNLAPTVKVDPDDGLPAHVCRQCVNQVNVSYNFKRQCELSDAAFRDYLVTQKQDISSPEEKQNKSETPMSPSDENNDNWAFMNVKAELSDGNSDENNTLEQANTMKMDCSTTSDNGENHRSAGPDYVPLEESDNIQPATQTSNVNLNVSSSIAPVAKKRRCRREELWKRNILKRQRRASSLRFVSPDSGVTYTGTECKCNLKCFTTVPSSMRTKILEHLHTIVDKQKQDIYLSGLIRVGSVQRRRAKTGSGKNRAYTCKYKVKVDDFEKPVCKKAFCSFYAIGKARVDRLIKHLNENTLPVDKRGKHQNRPNRIPDYIKQSIDDHINSFPKQSSQCICDKNREKQYLPPELNLLKMYRLYLEKYEPLVFENMQNGEKCRPVISYGFFCNRFSKHHNLCFGVPRAESCQKCHSSENQIKEEQKSGNLETLKFEVELCGW